MIIQALLHAFLFLIVNILGVIPKVMPTPAIFNTVKDTLVGLLTNGISILYWLLGSGFMIAVCSVIIAILVFEHAYKPVLWIIHKFKLS
jgi:hypothetical protein